MEVYEQGDVIRTEVDVKLRSSRVYALYDVANGCRITIYEPDKNTAIISSQLMTNEGVGLYYYNWQSTADSPRGVYRVRITADNATTVGTIEERLFKLK